MNKKKTDHPFVEIIEEPCSKVRFRYHCELRNTGNVLGASSNTERKTWPTIKIHGLKGRIASILVCCVSKHRPYYPHPHSVIGKDNRVVYGFYSFETRESVVTFPNMGIQCIRKKDVREALEKCQAYGVDPFGTGFNHKNSPEAIDLSAVRLCFQVFLKNTKEEKPSVILEPVVSKVVYDQKMILNLKIVKLSHCSAPVIGGTPMILLCGKIGKEKDNICIMFFELKDGKCVWEVPAKFNPNDIYKQHSIAFESPPYWDLNIEEPVHVYIQLRTITDDLKSDPLPFIFTPVGAESNITLKRKRQRYNTSGLIDMDFEEPKPLRHCPRCNCFGPNSAMTETRKIANKLLAFRPQTIEEKPSTIVRPPLINIDDKNDVPLDLHLRKNLMNSNGKTHEEKLQSYQEQLKQLDQQMIPKSHQNQQIQQQQLNDQLINQVQNLHQQQLNHVQNQYKQQQTHLQNQQQHNYVQNRQNPVQTQRINQQLNQQHRLQQQMLSPQQQLQQQMREKMIQQQKDMILSQQQQYQQMLPLQALQQLQAYPMMNQQQQQRKQLNQMSFQNQQPQIQNNYNIQHFQQQLRHELPITRQLEQLVELQNMPSSSHQNQPRQLMQHYQPQQLYQQQEQQQQYLTAKNERYNGPQSPIMINNGHQQLQLSMMDQNYSQQTYRTVTDDYSDESEDDEDQTDDINDDEFHSDGSTYVNNNASQIIQNRPPSLFTIRNTHKTQQQHNIAKYVDGNGNALDKVINSPAYQNNVDLDNIEVKRLSENLSSSLSLLDPEHNSQPYDVRNNNNSPALEDLLPFHI